MCVCVYIYLLIYGNKNSTELLFIHKCTLDTFSLGFPDGSVGKESAYNAGDVGFPWVGNQQTPLYHKTGLSASLVRGSGICATHSMCADPTFVFKSFLSSCSTMETLKGETSSPVPREGTDSYVI